MRLAYFAIGQYPGPVVFWCHIDEMCMRRMHNLRLARAIQCISGVLAVLMIYPLVRLIYPCWHRLKGTGNPGETGSHGKTGGPHASGPSKARGGPYASGPSKARGEPSGKSITQDK